MQLPTQLLISSMPKWVARLFLEHRTIIKSLRTFRWRISALSLGIKTRKSFYGIMLICLGAELKSQGLQIVSSLDLTSSNTRFKIASCRSKTENMLSSMWVYVSLDRPKESANNAKVNCKCDDIITPRPNRWEANNTLHDNLPCCDSCFWDHEATLFSSMLRKYLINKVH